MVAVRIIHNGLIHADHTGDKSGAPDPVIAQMCLTDKDKPYRGWYIQYVEHIEIGRGGLSFFEQILPASMMLDRIVAETSEGCNRARIAGGYPKMTFGNRGDWVWTEPCKRCQGAVAKQ